MERIEAISERRKALAI